MGVRVRAGVVAAAVLVGTASPVAFAARPSGAVPGPSVVVAVADTGVNPYHEVFHRPRNTAHPCTWVVGFTDCSIPALPLSVGKYDDPRTAFEADRDVWASVEPHQWYWIPRTNIIGAVCDAVVGGGATSSNLPYDGPTACIFDENGHGTGTASSVLTEAPDALLLVHEGNMGANDMASAPVVADIQSHSWGFAAPLPLQVAHPVYSEACDTGNTGRETLVFLAAGNESPMPSIADCWRSQPEIQVVGGGYPGYVQANSWTVYDFASWYCRPAATNDSVDRWDRHCGTSFAAPTAAGAAAAALLRVRRHDGYAGRSSRDRVSSSVTRDQFVDALRSAATYTPQTKFRDTVPCTDPTEACFGLRSAGVVPLPEQAPHLFWGYGWLDSTVTDVAVGCALRRSCPAKPVEAQVYNERRQQTRTVLSMQAWAPASDDAGSGRDAGEDMKTAVRIRAGVTYSGQLESWLDWRDGYTFRARAGQRLTVTEDVGPAAATPGTCWVLWGPGDIRLTPTSTGNIWSCEPGSGPPAGVQLAESGVYRIEYSSQLPQDYAFSIGLA